MHAFNLFCVGLPIVGLLISVSPQAAAQLKMAKDEIWAMDQNGNTLYVLDYEGGILRTIDGATLGDVQRPHMLWGVPRDEYVYSANTVSNSVTVLGSKDGKVKAVIQNVGKLPHAAQPNPKRRSRIYVSNIGPQAIGPDGAPDRGESITEIVRTAGPKWEVRRFLDLKAEPLLANNAEYPSRRPVCVGFSKNGRFMLVTLFNGGLAVVDLDAWEVVKAWGNDQIAQYGCGFAESPSGDEMYITAGDHDASWLYVFDILGEPKLVATHDLSGVGQDAHGVVVDPVRKDLWIVHRVSSNITIHPLSTIREPNHGIEQIDFVGKTPDLIALSSDYNRAYATLRGPHPAPTIPHATVGETPGVSIIDVSGRTLLKVVTLGDQVQADFHGIFNPASQR